jgi:hypothetical protein
MKQRMEGMEMRKSSYALYSRILELVTKWPAECRLRAVQSNQDPEGLFNIVRNDIATDKNLVWC